MRRDEDGRNEEIVRELLESASVEPAAEEREAILAAAEPLLRDLAGPALLDRLGALLAPRRVAFAAAAALLLGILFYPRGPETRDPRSAPLRTYAEHVWTESGSSFPLAPASFERPF